MVRVRSGKRQKITAYNVLILVFVGFGSMTYGYTASIIATTLGTVVMVKKFEEIRLTTIQGNQHS